LQTNGTKVSAAAVEAVEALVAPAPGEAFIEEEVSKAVKTLDKETERAESNNETVAPERLAELEARPCLLIVYPITLSSSKVRCLVAVCS